jgi:hypothetical protein
VFFPLTYRLPLVLTQRKKYLKVIDKRKHITKGVSSMFSSFVAIAKSRIFGARASDKGLLGLLSILVKHRLQGLRRASTLSTKGADKGRREA